MICRNFNVCILVSAWRYRFFYAIPTFKDSLEVQCDRQGSQPWLWYKLSSTMIKFAKSSRIVEKSRKVKQMQSQGEMKGNLISIFYFIRYTENSYDHRVKLYPTHGKNCCSVNNSLQNIKWIWHCKKVLFVKAASCWNKQ